MSSAREKRERKNLHIDGKPALIDGIVPEHNAKPVYYHKGTLYEHDGSAESVRWAAEGAKPTRTEQMRPKPKTLPKDVYPLEAIIGEREVDGQKQYLAKWGGRYARSEPSWEPANCFDDATIAEWEAEKADLEALDAEMEVDAAGASADETVKSSARQTTASMIGSENVNMPDIEAVERNSLISATKAHHVVTDTDATDADADADADAHNTDAGAECNDEDFALVVANHDEGDLCQGPHHSGKTVYTCSACRDMAIAMLDSRQQDAYELGADATLCSGCGEEHEEDEKSYECKCVTRVQCSACLSTTLDALAGVRKELGMAAVQRTCDTCDEDLRGNEKVSRCKLCDGLKVRL